MSRPVGARDRSDLADDGRWDDMSDIAVDVAAVRGSFRLDVKTEFSRSGATVVLGTRVVGAAVVTVVGATVDVRAVVDSTAGAVAGLRTTSSSPARLATTGISRRRLS